MKTNAEYLRLWRKANPERNKANRDRWRKAHPDKISEYNRRYREKVKARAAQKGADTDGV